MPRLRPSLRVLDPPGAVAQLPDLRRRRSAEAAVGVRRAVEHAGEVVLAPLGQRTHRSMRHLRRPARAGFLLDQLNSTRLRASGFGPRLPAFASLPPSREALRRDRDEARRAEPGRRGGRSKARRRQPDWKLPRYADLPDDADRILSDEWIGREDGEPVNDGLRHKNPIEWVAMQEWQSSDVERRFFVDAQR